MVEDQDGEEPADALGRELLEELGLDLAVLPARPVLRFVQDQEAERPGGSVPFRRRHLVFTAHLPDHLVADAAGLHLYPDVGAVLGRAVRPDAAVGGPVLPAMAGVSYQWC